MRKYAALLASLGSFGLLTWGCGDSPTSSVLPGPTGDGATGPGGGTGQTGGAGAAAAATGAGGSAAAATGAGGSAAAAMGAGGSAAAATGAGGSAPTGTGGSTAAVTGTGGSSAVTCAVGLTSCADTCVDTLSDAANCGACGTVCPAGQLCQAGVCQCPPGLAACASGCVDLQSDAAHCGACDSACTAGQVCSVGVCSSSCAAGLTQCGADCVDTNTSINHCGACNTPCATGLICAAGSCSCAAGQTLCDNQCVDTLTSPTHCGGCGIACAAEESCVNGACSCAAGEQLCNGLCTDTSSDALNCGGCGVACPEGQSCVSGSCQCANGQTECDGVCVDTSSDPANCGTCGTVCATGVCANGTCSEPVSTEDGCSVGWATVDGGTTGGEGGETVSVSNASDLTSAVSGDAARIVQISGTISAPIVNIGSNKTLIGVDSNATIEGGLRMSGVQNVIVKNLHINGASSTADGDGIHCQNSQHVCVDHVDIWDATDGNLDINDQSDYITVSWSIFHYSNPAPAEAHRYSNLVGSGCDIPTDVGRLRITYHHNWWSTHVHERMPRVRYGEVHIFNNLYTSSGNNYCIRATCQANLLVENNYFLSIDTPHEIDTSEGAITALEANGNTYDNTTGATDTSGSAFDPPYSYSLDSPDAARAAIEASAGPQ